jgi:hypothetical protein
MSAMTGTEGKGYGVCDCCGLLAPQGELLPWTRRMLCREFAVLDPERRSGRNPEDEWITGAFRHYYVTHDQQVCHACFDHLLNGGEFAGVLRHRTKLGFLILAAVLVAAIVLLPLIMPVLRSALWLDKGE